MIGMPRPPPTRPPIGLNAPSRFSSYASVEWAEDDAWDSASDSESSTQRPTGTVRSNSIGKITVESSTVARPVPRPKKSPSSNSLAFSYQHVNAPSPSSYSPRQDPIHSHKTSWTMVSKPPDSKAQTPKEEVISSSLGKSSEDFDIEDIDMGDIDADAMKLSRETSGSHFVKGDAEEIVQGMYRISSRNVSESPKECHDLRPSIEHSYTTSITTQALTTIRLRSSEEKFFTTHA